MNYPTVNPFLSSGATGDARNAASTRSADLAAAQDDHLIRRSDSPIANSPSKSSGSASVSGPSPLAKPAGVVAAPVGERANGLAPVSPGNGKDAATDSISLAQLKQITAVLPKARQSMYTFPAPPPDSHTLLNEIEEFYSYVEVPQVLEHKGSFQESWTLPTDFCDTPKQQQLDHIKHLLEGLTSTDPDRRFTAARNVLYIAQGTFASSSSPENHLHLILSNVTLLREAGALQQVWEAVKGTGIRWEGVSTIPDPDAPQSPNQFSAQDRQEYLEEINGELAIHLAILYLMVEVFRGDESWASELMQLEPPMPIYLFNIVAGLRERNAKGYPVKKLLLLLWKSILACIGGMKDIARVKSFVRDVEGLPPDTKGKGRENRPETKVAPTDYQAFRNEITAKYPSYCPPIATPVDLDRIAAAAAPTPIHSTFSYHINSSSSPLDGFPSANATLPNQPPGSQPPVPGGTPAPTPPASPVAKPKKQQFQTDQTRPFVLPFSRANAGPKGRPRVVPQSIDEAGELYRKNMRVSTELWQTWKLREEFMADESGITRAQKIEEVLKAEEEAGKGKAPSREELSNLSRRLSSVHIDDPESDSEEEDAMDPLSMLKKLEKSLKEEEDAESDDKAKKALTIRRGDVQRLERVEVLYRAILPQMQSAVIVLLKLLLATVTANNNLGGAGAGQNDSGTDDVPVLGLEDTDIMRHREITSKAVSAILILTLKWFKTSHVMKFHYLSQLLVDSNCLLLILKMFGLQEVSTSVKTKNEVEDFNFFRYCYLYGSKNPNPPRPEDVMLEPNPPGTTPGSPKINEDDVELISDYSWRNFFSVINFVHILQKLTKRKTHRVLLLVQYKSSAILKRILKVSHPTLQLYVLKVIKSQVPYCGRKWRQSNMKVITAIYLHCRPDLRDEWLTGIDVDADVEDSLPQEQALRSLVRFFNTKHYGSYAPLLHRRSSSGTSPAGDFHSAPPLSPGGGPGVAPEDVFPPTRSMTSFDVETSFRSSYGHEATDDLGDYELEDLLHPRYQLDQDGELETDPASTRAAWDRLGDILGHYDDVSDSESVESLGLMRFTRDTGSDGSVSDLDIDEEAEQRQARSDWVHMSPETITALEEERNSTSPRSPRARNRRSSTGPISPALRPVLIDRDDDTATVDEMDGPVPAEPHSGAAVDEVELVYNI